MDMKAYYQKLRAIEAGLPDEVVLISKATPEGGRAGQFTEASRAVAARMIADGWAEQASAADTEQFRAQVQDNHTEEVRRRAAARIQVNVITEDQARALGATPRIKGAK
jgi:hypothetical protein